MTQRNPQGLTKRQLIPPGEFFAIPYNVARDPRLAPVDKLVFGGLAVAGWFQWRTPTTDREDLK